VTAIDTLTIPRRLRDAGFEEKQATALTDMVRDVVSDCAAVKGDLQALESSLRLELARMETRSTVKFGVMLIAAPTVLFLALEHTPS